MTKYGFFKLVAIALALAVGLIACDQELPGSYPNSEALLKTITIAGKEVEPLPERIPSDVWKEDEPGNLKDLENDQTAIVILDSSTTLNSILVVEFTKSNNATVMWATGTYLTKPEDFILLLKSYFTFNPKTENVLYVRVTSEDKKHTNYYRFEIKEFDPVPTISSITIGDKTITSFNSNNSSTEGWSWNDKNFPPVKVNLSSGKNTNVKVVTSAAVIQYAKVKETDSVVVGTPDFQSIDEDANSFDFVDRDFLCIKLTTEDGQNPRWYKFQISIVLDVTSNAITFDPAE